MLIEAISKRVIETRRSINAEPGFPETDPPMDDAKDLFRRREDCFIFHNIAATRITAKITCKMVRNMPTHRPSTTYSGLVGSSAQLNSVYDQVGSGTELNTSKFSGRRIAHGGNIQIKRRIDDNFVERNRIAQSGKLIAMNLSMLNATTPYVEHNELKYHKKQNNLHQNIPSR